MEKAPPSCPRQKLSSKGFRAPGQCRQPQSLGVLFSPQPVFHCRRICTLHLASLGHLDPVMRMSALNGVSNDTALRAPSSKKGRITTARLLHSRPSSTFLALVFRAFFAGASFAAFGILFTRFLIFNTNRSDTAQKHYQELWMNVSKR